MKTLTSFLLMMLCASSSALAAPTKSAVDKKAYRLLVENLDSLTNQDGETLSDLVGRDFKRVFAGDKSYQVSNSCSYDSSDSLFDCEFQMIHSSEGLESSIRVIYQLERGEDGLPSGFFFLTVETLIAG
jgi:hypothetical protein